MEPPPFGDGNKAMLANLLASGMTSMEPPPFGDGNSPKGIGC